MEILVDTNVLLDFVQERAEADTAAEIITICAKDDNITGYISAHSLMDMCYILRKIFSADERLDMLRQLCNIFTVIETTKEVIIKAAEDKDFTDFEDSVVNQSAVKIKADYIVTRDMTHGHFKNSDVQVITPVDFINLIN